MSDPQEQGKFWTAHNGTIETGILAPPQLAADYYFTASAGAIYSPSAPFAVINYNEYPWEVPFGTVLTVKQLGQIEADHYGAAYITLYAVSPTTLLSTPFAMVATFQSGFTRTFMWTGVGVQGETTLYDGQGDGSPLVSLQVVAIQGSVGSSLYLKEIEPQSPS